MRHTHQGTALLSLMEGGSPCMAAKANDINDFLEGQARKKKKMQDDRF